MAFALLIFGAVLLISGVRNTVDGPNGLFALIKGDFTGSNNFIFWFAAILIIGAVGLIDKLKPISTAFLVLVIVSMVLSNGGFFQLFTQGISSTQAAQPTAAAPILGSPAWFNQAAIVGSPGVVTSTPGFVPATQPTLAQLGATPGASYTGLE